MEPGVDATSNQQKQLADEIMETLNRFTSIGGAPPTAARAGSLTDSELPAVVFASQEAPPAQVSASSSSSSGWRRSPGSSSSYNDEWDWLFAGGRGPKDLESHLAECSLRGNLRSCRFRSVCWKVHLGVLSGDRGRWPEETEKWRRKYRELSAEFVIDPHAEEKCVDSAHPLSLDDDSAWHRFFQGKARRDEIMKDVTRTFPDIGFFQTPLAQKTMINVLFIYSNVSPLAYRQGMHELLAPIIFVLHSDHLAFQHASEQQHARENSARRELACILDLDYLEHDAYAIFSQLMQVAGQWYVIDEYSPEHTPVHAKEPFVKPFSLFRPGSASDGIRNCPAILQLARIHNERLKKTDLVLFEHLERLEVVPQFYGIRWLRLLFGREFPLQDLLVVWDAIFATCDKAELAAESTDAFPLVDHLFVVMVVLISDLLCRCDFAQAVMHLMNYPLYCDVHTIVASALHSYRPEAFAKPADRALCPLLMTPSAGHGGHSRGTAVRRTQSALAPRSSQSNVIQAVGLEGITARLRTMDMGGKLIRRFGSSAGTNTATGAVRERPKSLMVTSREHINGSGRPVKPVGSGKGQTELQRLTGPAVGVESAPVTPVSSGPGYLTRLPRRKMRSSRSAERGAPRRHGGGGGGPSGDFVEILTDEEERRQLEANLRATLQTIDNYRQLTKRAGDLVENGLERLMNATRRMDRRSSRGGIINAGSGDVGDEKNFRQVEELTLAVADLKKARDYLRGSLNLTSGEAADDDRSSAGGQSSADDFTNTQALGKEVELRELHQ